MSSRLSKKEIVSRSHWLPIIYGICFDVFSFVFVFSFSATVVVWANFVFFFSSCEQANDSFIIRLSKWKHIPDDFLYKRIYLCFGQKHQKIQYSPIVAPFDFVWFSGCGYKFSACTTYRYSLLIRIRSYGWGKSKFHLIRSKIENWMLSDEMDENSRFDD